MFVVGRMSAQVPMNMTIVGCMMTFHRSAGVVVLCAYTMLGRALGPSPHPGPLWLLSAAASRPDWRSVEDIDVPLHQHSLSIASDEAVSQHLSTAPSTCARALVLSSTLPHAGNWLNGVPSATLGLHLQDQEFGWEFPFTALPTPAQSATVL